MKMGLIQRGHQLWSDGFYDIKIVEHRIVFCNIFHNNVTMISLR